MTEFCNLTVLKFSIFSVHETITDSWIIRCPERDVQKLNLKKRNVLHEAIETIYYTLLWRRWATTTATRGSGDKYVINGAIKVQACSPVAEILQNVSRKQHFESAIGLCDISTVQRARNWFLLNIATFTSKSLVPDSIIKKRKLLIAFIKTHVSFKKLFRWKLLL
jgi:hypothetical protein